MPTTKQIKTLHALQHPQEFINDQQHEKRQENPIELAKKGKMCSRALSIREGSQIVMGGEWIVVSSKKREREKSSQICAQIRGSDTLNLL